MRPLFQNMLKGPIPQLSFDMFFHQYPSANNLNEVSLPLAFWVEENHHVVNLGMIKNHDTPVNIKMEPNTEDEGDFQVPC